MTHIEMKRKVLALIEEPMALSGEALDAGIEEKYIFVANQVMMELSEIGKNIVYFEADVEAGDTLDLDGLSELLGRRVRSIISASGAGYEMPSAGRLIRAIEGGNLFIECYVYPELIEEGSCEGYVFDLPPELLEIMPYGIAADLLACDGAADYGAVFRDRYRSMTARLMSRGAASAVSIEGGVII